MANQDRAPFSHAVERDLRLDLFRGMGLWMIFLDHIPHDIVAWLTLRNYGFSDAAEFFVFISGYLAGFIYGPIVRGGHFFAATKRLVMRAWQMYVAHIMLFLLFTAQIARTVRKFDNPMYEDEFNVHNFLQHPDVLIGQALSLRYKPVNLDVLPLYISLVLASPLILWCLVRRPNWTLLGSAVLYVLAVVVTRYLPRNWAPLTSKWLRPLILCGQHSLPIFCLGVFLSFGAHWILMQYTRGVWEQLVVSAAGIVIMVAAAWLLDRAAKVPNLFVEAAELEPPKTATEPGKA